MFVREEKYPFKGKSVEIISINGPTVHRFVTQLLKNMENIDPEQHNWIIEKLKEK